MIEEALNFGMNAIQISQISDLNSRTSDLDALLYNIKKEQKQLVHMQEDIILRQEKEAQIRESINITTLYRCVFLSSIYQLINASKTSIFHLPNFANQ